MTTFEDRALLKLPIGNKANSSWSMRDPARGMTRRGVLGVMAAAGVSLVAGACGLLSSNSYRYRMTVEVDTPQGLRSGSSVREISSRLQIVPGRGGPTPLTKFKGEAVAVDLPNGRTLFALLDETINVTSIFEPDDRTPELFVANVAKLGRRDQRGRTVVLPADKYPRMVTFRDISDPTSVQAVEPANLAASFGPGMRLRRIALEITGDGVTSGIEKRFSWWNEYLERHFDGTSTVMDDLTTSDLRAHLSSGSFSTESQQ